MKCLNSIDSLHQNMFLRRTLPLAVLMLRRGRFSLKKIITMFQNYFLGNIVKSERRGKTPSVMMIELSNVCNLACKVCALQMPGSCSNQAKRGMINYDVFCDLVDNVKENLLLLSPYLGGESFLHPRAMEMLKYAASQNISVSMTTNGSFEHIDNFGEKIIDSGIDVLVFSISGTIQDVYSRLHRNGDLSKVIANIRSVTRFPKKIRPRVVVRYLLTPENKEDVCNVPRFTKELGADLYEIRPVDGTLHLVDNLKDNLASCESRNKLSSNSGCFWLWSSLVVKAGGQVIPCCYDYYGVPELGVVEKDKLSVVSMWNGDSIKKFRNAFYRSGSKLDCCSFCNFSTGYQDRASEGIEKIPVRRGRLSL